MTNKIIARQILDSVDKRLPEWLGDGATLATHESAVEKCRHSFLLRCTALTSHGPAKLLVKVARRPTISTLQEAVRTSDLRRRSQTEHEFLCTAWEAFSSGSTPGCFAVRPFAYLARWNAIVMSLVEGRSLKQLLLRPAIAAGASQPWRQLEATVARSAAWLRSYHLHAGVTEEPMPTQHVRSEIDQNLDEIERATAGGAETASVRSRLLQAVNASTGCLVPVSRLHHAFHAANILVAPDGRVAAIDSPRSARAPIFIDLATMLTDPATIGAQIMSCGLLIRPGRLARYEAAIFASYSDPRWSLRALHLYCAIHVVRRWNFVEKQLGRSGPPGYVPLRILRRPCRAYLRSRAIAHVERCLQG
jgi:hypothetical protein